MTKHAIVINDIKGTEIDRATFWFRRNAAKFALQMRAPFYDVIHVDRKGVSRIIYRHIPPEEFAAAIKRKHD